MNPTLASRVPSRRLWSGNDWTLSDALGLVAHAQRPELPRDQPLSGKNLALLSKTPVDASVHGGMLELAAVALGARVSHVSLSGAAFARDELTGIAQMLGRLYDGVDGGSPATGADMDDRAAHAAGVGHVAAWAGVPVFDGLNRPDHAGRMLADLASVHVVGRRALGLVVFMGDLRGARGDALAGMCLLMGVELRVDGVPAAAVHPLAGAWIDGRAGPWTLGVGAAVVGDTDRFEMHRRLMQAILIETMTS